MGENTSDLEREIEQLRTEMGLIIDELEGRAKQMADVKAQARSHPLAAGSVGFAMLTLMLLLGYAIFGRRSQPLPVVPQRRGHGGLWAMVGFGLGTAVVVFLRRRTRLLERMKLPEGMRVPSSFGKITEKMGAVGRPQDFLGSLENVGHNITSRFTVRPEVEETQ
jgi:hypothetical protein